MEEAPGRLKSLDGLRGVAALIVVVHHTLLTVPSLSNAYLPVTRQAIRFTTSWWLTWTPLHLAWAGGEAVIVFFVLSGFVLALPYVRQARTSWNAYYGKRLVRLYAPVVVAVLVALVLLVAVARDHGTGGSGWLTGHPAHVHLADVLRDMVLVGERPGAVNSALWSLHWEAIFSLLLPFFVFLAGLGSKRPWLLAVVTLAVLAYSPYTDEIFYYLPIFLIGSILAVAYPRVQTWIGRVNSSVWSRLVWSLLIVAALTLLLTHWLLGRVLADHGLSVFKVEAVLRVMYGVGAALLIVTALGSATFKRLLCCRPLHWLGRRSYSLYLIHEPIIVTCAFGFGRNPSLGWFLPLMIVASLCAAEIFYRLVEQPSLKLAARVAKRIRASEATAEQPGAVAAPSGVAT